MLDLRKILSTNLKQVQKWKDIISTFQAFLYVDLMGFINSLENKDIESKATQADLENTIYDFGHNLFKGAGYTMSLEYIRREYRTVVKRIKNKGTEPSYEYIFWIFNLIGNVYPMFYDVTDESLNPWLNWLSAPDITASAYLLDDGHFLDDPDDPWTLDNGNFSQSLTRHILLSYAPQFSESTTDFMSTDTARALHNDVLQNKRRVEIPHYEWRVYMDGAPSAEKDTEYPIYDQSGVAQSRSIGIGNLTQSVKVRFGVGSHLFLSPAITDVEDFVQEIPLTDFNVTLIDGTHLYARYKIFVTTTFFDFSEIAIMSGTNQCLFYSTFPFYRYSSQMYGSVYLFASVS